MKGTGTALQVIAAAIVIGGVALGILAMMTPIIFRGDKFNTSGTGGTGLALMVSGLVVGVLFNAAGLALRGLADIVTDTHRSAEALDLLVQRRTGVGTLPPDAAKRLRQQPPQTPRQSP